MSDKWSIIRHDGVEVTVYRSPEDNKYVVEIDTSRDENDIPPLRVWVNEALISE